MKKTPPIFYRDKITPYPAENSTISNYKVDVTIVATRSSVVYNGFDMQGNKVILKFIKITELNENHVKTEVALLHQVNHPNIIKLIDDFPYSPYHCVVMEWAPFGSLDMLVDQNRSFGLKESTVLQITIQLLHGLNYLHEQHIWHRDMKLENILVFNNNLDSPIVKISDFGLAVNASKVHPIDRVGSNGYVAPEIVKGDQCMLSVISFFLFLLIFNFYKFL